MVITFLGTGTSHGIPVIGCNCSVCKSKNKKNRRTRSSIYIKSDAGTKILIDTSLDFREQALRENLERPDAIFFTHDHADHLFGLDDLRIWCEDSCLNIFCDSKTKKSIKTKYAYIFKNKNYIGGSIPNFKIDHIKKEVKIKELEIIPIKILHGKNSILGFRINDFAYITDCKTIPPNSINRLKGIKTLIINGLKFSPHPTHFSIDETLEIIKKIAPEKTYITHICHNLEHKKVNGYLPKNVKLAYDGQKIII